MSTTPEPTIDIADDYVSILHDNDLGDYESIMTTKTGEVLMKANLGQRERIRLELPVSSNETQTFYLKRYGDNEPAETEWRALEAVQAAGVPTMRPVATGTGPAGGFIIVTAVPGEALSRSMDELLIRRGQDPAVHEDLAELLGMLAGTLHAAGLAHRDFYTTHIFLHEQEGALELYLIDLARIFCPQRRCWRWWLKDLAQLKYSLPVRWRERHWGEIRAAYVAQRKRRLPLLAETIINIRVWNIARRMKRKAAATGQGT